MLAERSTIVLKQRVQQFLNDVMRLLRASPIFGGLVVATGVVLAFGPILFWQFLARFIDSAYGARGIGTITSDLTHSATMIVIMFCAMVAAIVYSTQTTGLSRRIVTTLALVGIVFTHVVTLFSITRGFLIFLFVIVLAAWLIRRTKHTVKNDRIIRLALITLILLLAIVTWRDLLLMMTVRSVTVGNMLHYSGVLLTLCACAAGWSAYRSQQ